jgi:MFS family permease
MATVRRLAASNVLTVLAFAMTGPLLVVELAQRGWSATAVGAFAAGPFLEIFLGAPLGPWIRSRLGPLGAHRLGLGLATAGAAVTAAVPTPAGWTAGYLVSGLGAAVLWGLSDALLAENAPVDRVGRVTAAFQTFIGLCFATGPFLPAVLGLGVVPALWAGVGVVVLAWLPVATLAASAFPGAGAPHPATPSLPRLMMAVGPLLAASALVGGVFETGSNALGAVQALALGLAPATAVMVPGVIGVGSLLGQIPAGWIADRLSARTAVLGGLALLAASAAVLSAAPAQPSLLWPVAFVWGAAGGALYTLAIVHIGVTLRGSGSVGAATAAAISLYTGGALVGPLLSGPAMDLDPDHGLAAVLGAVALAGLAAVFALAGQRRRGP